MGNGKIWLHGLVAALIGGASNAGLMLYADSEHFNFSHAGLLALAKIAGAGAILAVLAYLKQSPVPPSWDGQDRRAGGTTVEQSQQKKP